MDDEKAKLELIELRRMVEGAGWRIFVRTTQDNLAHLRESGWDSITTMEKLWYAKGCMDTMRNIVALEQRVTYEEPADEAAPE